MQIKTFHSFHPEHQPLYKEILMLMRSLNSTYPESEKWFTEKFLSGLKKKERTYIVAWDRQKSLAGYALIKNTPTEKKICTIFVKPPFRKQGIGKQLIQKALTELGEHPLITVSGKTLPLLQPLLQQSGFHLSAVKKGVYRPEDTEYYFNDQQADSIKNGLIPVLIQRMEQLKQK